MNTALTGTMDKVLQVLPYLIAGVVTLVLVAALFIGFAKGFRRISKKTFAWLVAGVAFVVCMQYGLVDNLLAPLGVFAPIACAFACTLLGLVVYALLSILFRPRFLKSAKEGDRGNRDANGFEYDDEAVDYDDYTDYKTEETFIAKGYRKPNLFGRLFGGIFCMLNAATVMAAVIAFALLIVHGTKIGESAPALYEMKLFGVEWLPLVLPYLADYALDFLFMGIAFAIAFKGQKKGFFESLRVLLVKVGALAAIVVCFWLPFSAYLAEDNLVGKALVKCMQFVEYFGLSGAIGVTVAKILTGLLFSLLVIIVFILLNWLFKRLVEFVDNVGFLQAIDGSLACLIYLVIGFVVAALVITLGYVLNHYGIFSTSAVASEKAFLSQNLFALLDVYIKPILLQIDGAVKGVFSGFAF